MARMKQEGEDMERILRERISKLEQQRLDMEEEISRLKATNVADKLNSEEQVSSLKHRLKSEEVIVGFFYISLTNIYDFTVLH